MKIEKFMIKTADYKQQFINASISGNINLLKEASLNINIEDLVILMNETFVNMVNSGNVKIVDYLLNSAELKVNANIHYLADLALSDACKKNNYQMIELLLNNGIDCSNCSYHALLSLIQSWRKSFNNEEKRNYNKYLYLFLNNLNESKNENEEEKKNIIENALLISTPYNHTTTEILLNYSNLEKLSIDIFYQLIRHLPIEKKEKNIYEKLMNRIIKDCPISIKQKKELFNEIVVYNNILMFKIWIKHNEIEDYYLPIICKNDNVKMFKIIGRGNDKISDNESFYSSINGFKIRLLLLDNEIKVNSSFALLKEPYQINKNEVDDLNLKTTDSGDTRRMIVEVNCSEYISKLLDDITSKNNDFWILESQEDKIVISNFIKNRKRYQINDLQILNKIITNDKNSSYYNWIEILIKHNVDISLDKFGYLIQYCAIKGYSKDIIKFFEKGSNLDCFCRRYENIKNWLTKEEHQKIKKIKHSIYNKFSDNNKMNDSILSLISKIKTKKNLEETLVVNNLKKKAIKI